jgi:hypothetical protein
MRLRTLVVAGALVAGLMAAAPISASANILWCVGDPPVQIVTPGGHYLVVNNYLYVSPGYRHLASKVTADGYAIPDGALGTLVTVHVHVPPGLSHLFVVSAQQHYKVTTSGDGEGGAEITLTLDVPES